MFHLAARWEKQVCLLLLEMIQTCECGWKKETILLDVSVLHILCILLSNPAWETTFFRLYPRFSGSASGFKELPLLLICHSSRLPFFACVFVSTCRSIQLGTLLHGFGETKCCISLYSQLFVLHSRSTWGSCEWMRGCRCMEICDITDWCFILCSHILLHLRTSSWGFVCYTVREIIMQLS